MYEDKHMFSSMMQSEERQNDCRRGTIMNNPVDSFLAGAVCKFDILDILFYRSLIPLLFPGGITRKKCVIYGKSTSN